MTAFLFFLGSAIYHDGANTEGSRAGGRRSRMGAGCLGGFFFIRQSRDFRQTVLYDADPGAEPILLASPPVSVRVSHREPMTS